MSQESLSSRWERLVLCGAVVFALLAGVVGFSMEDERPVSASTPGASPVAESATPPVREVLVAGDPNAADGQVLQLVRYHIPAGMTLPMHTHPGMQIAYIEAGVLTYTVVTGGEIPITQGPNSDSPGATELLGPGETTELHPGDAVVEVDGVVHFGANLGAEPVIILASTLLDPNQPAAVEYIEAASPVASPMA
ncbi:MAG: hypothetical protein KC438_00875 [Thermomicrobiales bacterium]|nr:hypothetical protein [Thermomicrobiales bacterium]MCO5220631.1 hypothetical protein [Thermomicrobiales bacterium]